MVTPNLKVRKNTYDNMKSVRTGKKKGREVWYWHEKLEKISSTVLVMVLKLADTELAGVGQATL